jgi:predicted ATPase
MLKNLHIKNFKGWQDTQPIEMAPITLFFGANSSGKSSIGQFLMMLKQTIESPDRRSVFFPGNQNSAVELGSYQEMVFQRNPKNKISFEYMWDFEPSLKLRDPIADQLFEGNILKFKAEVGLNGLEQNSPAVDSLSYELFSEENSQFLVEMEKNEKKQDYKLTATGYTLKKNTGRVWPLKSLNKFYGFPEEAIAYHQNADFLQELNLQHEKLFRSVFYLGPLRDKAARLYSWAGTEPESVGYGGENTIRAILSAKTRKIGLGYKRPAKPFEEVIAAKLQEMNLIQSFKVHQISEGRQEYDVKVKSNGSGDMVDLPDVGFGISQVLPVLVQCFYAPKNSIIIMEQPEIHLHPSAQSALADVMIDVINSKENGSDRNIQLIIETHSEHFLKRLQRRIAEEKVDRKSVKAFYADTSSYPTKLKNLEIDLFGNIKNWPTNFFGDEIGDIAGQAAAALKLRASNKIGK